MFKAGGPTTESGDDTPERFRKQTTRNGEDVRIYTKEWTQVWREWASYHLSAKDKARLLYDF
eukprot:4757385-Prymnesium_polylepis.1